MKDVIYAITVFIVIGAFYFCVSELDTYDMVEYIESGNVVWCGPNSDEVSIKTGWSVVDNTVYNGFIAYNINICSR